MSNKALYIIIAVLILLGIGFYIYSGKQQAPVTQSLQNSAKPQVTQQPANNQAPATATSGSTPAVNSTTTPHFSNEADTGGQATIHLVTYSGTAFSPASLTIKSGDTVVFKNASSSSFRPASDPHPTHTDYPGFDSKQAVAAGGNFSFIFTKVGSWGYHNHLNPSQTGKIVVTK
jgi:plastocyanin